MQSTVVADVVDYQQVQFLILIPVHLSWIKRLVFSVKSNTVSLRCAGLSFESADTGRVHATGIQKKARLYLSQLASQSYSQ